MNPQTITLEEARNLAAGPESDALIALICEAATGQWPMNGIWQPTTDANAAIEAALIGTMGFYLTMLDEPNNPKCCIAHLLCERREEGDPYGEAPDVPLAICRARAVYHVQQRDRLTAIVNGDTP